MTNEESLKQDTNLLQLIPLAEFSKQKVTEEQRKQLNHDKGMLSLFLDSGFRDTILAIKEKLINGDTDDLRVSKERVP